MLVRLKTPCIRSKDQLLFVCPGSTTHLVQSLTGMYSFVICEIAFPCCHKVTLVAFECRVIVKSHMIGQSVRPFTFVWTVRTFIFGLSVRSLGSLRCFSRFATKKKENRHWWGFQPKTGYHGHPSYLPERTVVRSIWCRNWQIFGRRDSQSVGHSGFPCPSSGS